MSEAADIKQPIGVWKDAHYGAERGDNQWMAFDPKKIVSAIYRNRLLAGGMILGALLLGALVTILTTRQYVASSTVQINQEAAKVIGTEQADASAAIQDSDRFLQTQLDIIRSRSLAISVAEDIRLFNNPKFLTSMNEEQITESSGKLSLKEAQKEQVIEVLGDNLGATLPIDSRLARITFTSPDPVLAAKVTNSFLDNYIRNNLQRKFDTSSYAREFLKGQLDQAGARLAESERNAVEYARRTRIIDTANPADTGQSRVGSQSLTTSTLVQLNSNYAAAVARRIDAQKKWEAARRSSALDLPAVLANPAIQKLLEERAKTESDYKEEQQRRKEDFPTVRRAKARLDELNRQIQTIASAIRTSHREEFEAAAAQERALNEELTRLKSQSLDEQSQGVQLGLLRREADTNRELYDLLLKRFNELNAEAGGQSNNLTVVDRATTPIDPDVPDVAINILLSLIAGIAFAAFSVFIREFMFDNIRTPEDVEEKLNLAVLGTIPVVRDGLQTHEVLADQKSATSEAYSATRTSLLMASSHGAPKTIMLTSTGASEGKSTSCFALALSFSRIGKNVCVIDLDLRKPNQHNMFGLENNKGGMVDLLTQRLAIADVIQQTGIDNISFIGCGMRPPNPTELLSGAVAENVLRSLELEFDIVIVDSAPVLGLADALLLSSITEGTVFIISAGDSQTPAVRNAIRRIQGAGGRINGVLLTKFDARNAGYSYSDYAYQYKYGVE